MLDFPPELRERLLLEPARFDEVLGSWLGAVQPRECGAEQIDWGLAYPWERPPRSYLLDDGRVTLLEVGEQRAELVERYAQDRHPILAFGSNASPSTLTRKFAH